VKKRPIPRDPRPKGKGYMKNPLAGEKKVPKQTVSKAGLPSAKIVFQSNLRWKRYP